MISNTIWFIIYGIIFCLDIYLIYIRIKLLNIFYKKNKNSKRKYEILKGWFNLILMILTTLLIATCIILKIIRITNNI